MYKIPDEYSKLSNSSKKKGKSEKLSHRKLRGMAAECNVHPETEKDMRGKK